MGAKMDDQAISCLKNANIFKFLDEQTLRQIAKKVFVRQFPQKSQIYSPSDAKNRVYLLREGEVNLYELSYGGKKVVLDVLGDGSVFGDIALGDGQGVGNFAESKTKVTICEIAKVDFLKIIREVPEVALRVVEELSLKLSDAEEKIKDLTLSLAPGRLLRALIRLAAKFGQEQENFYIFCRKFSHEELAQLIGTSRETVTKTLNILKREKILSFDNQNCFLINKRKIDLLLDY